MMMATPEVYTISPNRSESHATQSAIEVVANFIEKIPEMNVKFEGDNFALKTSYNSSAIEADQAIINFTIEMEAISKMVVSDLKVNGYPNAKAKLEDIDVDAGMYRSAGSGVLNRQAVYTVSAYFILTV